MHWPEVAQSFCAVKRTHPQYGWDFPGEVPEKPEDPGTAHIAYPGIPLESTAGMPQALPSRSGSGEDLSEPILELPAVLGVCLRRMHAREREKRERQRERGRRAREGEGSRPGRETRQRKKRNMTWCKPDLPSTVEAVLPSKQEKEGTKTRAGPKRRNGEEEGGRGEKKNRKPRPHSPENGEETRTP